MNLALREYVERHRPVAALERHAVEAKDWDYDAWRLQSDADKRPAG